jgi:hypothetical protein
MNRPWLDRLLLGVGTFESAADANNPIGCRGHGGPAVSEQ